MSAISKIQNSGLDWAISEAPYLSLEVIRFSYYDYITDGNVANLERGWSIAHWMLDHCFIMKLLLVATLMLEFFAFVMLFDKKLALIYAIALLIMHIGIYIVLRIVYPAITLPMLVVFVNPTYRLQMFINLAIFKR